MHFLPPRFDWEAEVSERSVSVVAPGATLNGELFSIARPRAGVVVSSVSATRRLASRECFGARLLARDGFATLLLDLVAEEEELAPQVSTDVPRLATRLVAAGRLLSAQTGIRRVGHLASGAALSAAMVAASVSQSPDVFAVVGRGGELGRAGAVLASPPTLWLLGEDRRVETPLAASVFTAEVGGDPESVEGVDSVLREALPWFDHWLDRRPPQP